MFQQQLLDTLFQALDSEGCPLDDRDCRIVKRRLKWRPFLRRHVQDYLTSELIVAGVVPIAMTDPAGIDWESVLQLILEYLPQIIDLILNLFS